MRKRMLSMMVAVTLIAGMLVGCSTPKDDTKKETAKAAEEGASKSGGDETYNIGYCNQQLKEDFFITVEAGLKKAAEDAGYEYNLATTDRDSTKMASSIDTLQTMGADIIVDFNCLPEQGAASAEKLQGEGIPMLAVDSDYGDVAYFFGVNNYDAGETLGNGMKDFVESKFDGSLDYVVCLWDSQAGDSIKDRCLGGADVLVEAYGLGEDQVVWLDMMADDTKTRSMTQDWLESHPDAKKIAFIGQNDDRGYAITQAVLATGREGDSIVGSHNADPSAVENFQKQDEANPWVLTVSYESYNYGSQIFDYVKAILSGDAEGEKERFAKTMLVTCDNVEEYVKERDEVEATFK